MERGRPRERTRRDRRSQRRGLLRLRSQHRRGWLWVRPRRRRRRRRERVLPLRAAGPLQPRVPAEREAPGDWDCPRGCGIVFASKESCFKCFTPRVTTDDDRGRDGYAPVPRRDSPPRDEPARRRPRTKTSRDSDRTTQRAGDDRDEPANDARRNDEVRYGDFLECRTCYHPPFPPSTPPPPDAKVPETRSQIQMVAFVRLLFGFFFSSRSLRFPSGHSTLLRRARGRRVRGRIRLG